mgnify:CR=1 FL=1
MEGEITKAEYDAAAKDFLELDKLQQIAKKANYGVIPKETLDGLDEGKLRGLIEIYKTVEYPALIHCKSGSDRTGIAAALYRILILNQTVKEASNELHWSYGHIKTSHTGVLDYFLERYVSHTEKQKISFLEWVKDYDPVSLKNEFRSSGFMSLLFDKIIKRE